MLHAIIPRIMSTHELPRKLGLLDSAAIVVGNVIGSAIFIVLGGIAQNLPSTGMILLVWISTGVLSFFGALAYAEMGAMMPGTGGHYLYLREAFGPFWAFLCGWALLLVIQSGSIAAVAAAFSIYVSYFVPLTPLLSKAAAVGLIVVLTYINYRGIESGALVQNIFTCLKLVGLVVIIGSAFLTRMPPRMEMSLVPTGFSWSQFGVAMIACLWAYEGWANVSFVAGEIKHPQRNLPRSLALGMAVVIAVYVLATVAYMIVLPIGEIAKTERVAATVAQHTMGAIGASLVSLTILMSIIGTNNSGIMTSPRVYYAMASDGLFFNKIAGIHPRYKTPAPALLLQGVWSAILAVTGSYDRLFSYVIFAAWIFYGMSVSGVLILRRTHCDVPRPYKMWGYPITPILFAGVSLWFVVNTLITTPGPSIIGILIVGAGAPVYFVWRRNTA
jgi:basic amino acid/polyamine antiporter, APA family